MKDYYEGLVHGDTEHHETKTWGVQMMTPSVVGMVFRIKPARKDATQEQKEHTVEVLERWINRWGARQSVIWTNLSIGTVGGESGQEGDVPDGLAAVFNAMVVPTDWLCFASMMAEKVIPRPAMMPMILGGMPGFALGFDEEAEETETVATELGGRKHAIGGTKKDTIN